MCTKSFLYLLVTCVCASELHRDTPGSVTQQETEQNIQQSQENQVIHVFQKITVVFDQQVNFQNHYDLFVDGRQVQEETIRDNPAVINPDIQINTLAPPTLNIGRNQAVCESRPLDLAILVDSSRNGSGTFQMVNYHISH